VSRPVPPLHPPRLAARKAAKIYAWLVFSVLLLILPAAAAKPPHAGIEMGPEDRAEFLLANGQFDQALQAYREILQKNAESGAAVRGLVLAFDGQGKRREAEAELMERLRERPGSSALHYGLGFLYYLEKRDVEAENQFQEATRLNPENALAWNNWGALKIRTKSYTEGVEMVRRAIRLDPENLLFYNNLYVIYGEMGANGLFFAEFRELVAAGDKVRARGYGKALARAWRQEAFKLYAGGEVQAALKKFADVADIYRKSGDTGGLVAALFGLALLHEEAGEDERAREIYREVLEISPGHIQARDRLKKKIPPP